ncbi:hypothetical protein ACQ4PT_046372 [Festuca glaucescens]
MDATKELSIKLLINTETKTLCFAEASSDVVKFLTGLLSLPLGTVTSLLAKKNMAGSVGNLLVSAEKLDANLQEQRETATPRYTVKDDLSMTPASISLIAMLAESGVKDLSVLQEKTVKIGKEEALGILAAALAHIDPRRSPTL